MPRARADDTARTKLNPAEESAPGTVFTIGHSTRTLPDFVSLLRDSGIAHVIDVRSIPRSRAVPQFNGDTLPGALKLEGIDYTHLTSLGGRRHRAKGAPESANTFWRVLAFRNYADYAASPQFRRGLDELEAMSREARCVVMCAEAVWWRCHRRIIADYLLSRGVPVKHIIGPHNVVAAALTPEARLQVNGTIRYPAPDDTAA